MTEIVDLYSDAIRYSYAGYSYSELRRIHKEFNSQLDANALYDARNFHKTVLKTHNYPKKLNPLPLLRRQDFKIDGNKASIIYKPRNRLVLGVFPSERQLKLIEEATTKGARLVKRDDALFLNLVLEKCVELPRWKECEAVIGVDIGINYIAVCSASAKDGKLGYLENNSWNRRWNFLLGNWARRKLQNMIEYKALWEGIPVAYVNPAYTSQYCHYCGAKGKRTGITFQYSKCGRTYNTDPNASMNLARQFLDKPKAMTGERSAEDLGSSAEGETCLPRQTQIQPRNGKQMNRIMVTRMVSLPLGLGGA